MLWRLKLINRRKFLAVIGVFAVVGLLSLTSLLPVAKPFTQLAREVAPPVGTDDQIVINQSLQQYGFIELEDGATYEISDSIIYPDRDCGISGKATIISQNTQGAPSIKIGDIDTGFYFAHEWYLEEVKLYGNPLCGNGVEIYSTGGQYANTGIRNVLVYQHENGFWQDGGIGLIYEDCHAIANRGKGFQIGYGTGMAHFTRLINCKSVRNQIGIETSNKAQGVVFDTPWIESNYQLGIVCNDRMPTIVNGWFENNPVNIRAANSLVSTLYATGNKIWLKNGQVGVELQGWENYLGSNIFDMQSANDVAIHLLSGTAYSKIEKQQWCCTNGTKILNDSGNQTNIIEQ